MQAQLLQLLHGVKEACAIMIIIVIFVVVGMVILVKIIMIVMRMIMMCSSEFCNWPKCKSAADKYN